MDAQDDKTPRRPWIARITLGALLLILLLGLWQGYGIWLLDGAGTDAG
jgi:hypothetical protein